jgi:hypothetical protein
MANQAKLSKELEKERTELIEIIGAKSAFVVIIRIQIDFKASFFLTLYIKLTRLKL